MYEYAFEKNVSFSQFLKFPGETVKKGEVLVKAENTLLDIIKEMDEVMEQEFSKTFKIGIPAVPPGSPSSLNLLILPVIYE